MRTFLFFVYFEGLMSICFSQKIPLSYETIENWPIITSKVISNNGKFVLYSVRSQRSGLTSKFFIRSTDKSFSKEIEVVGDASFSEDSRRVIYIRPGDSLCILELNNSKEYYIPNAKSFKMPKEGIGKWLACQLKTNELLLYDLFSMEKRNYTNVNNYIFSDN